jgi:Tol biopolymer transport system component
VFLGSLGPSDALLQRRFDRLGITAVRGTGTAGGSTAFSPDGSRLAFVTAGTLRWVPIDGGLASEPLAFNLQERTVGTSWVGGRIVTAGPDRDLVEIVVASGDVRTLGSAPEGVRWILPFALPDGRGVILTERSDHGEDRVSVLPEGGGEPVRLVEGSGGILTESGHLVWWRDASLWAAQVDLVTFTLISAPVRVEAGVASLGFPVFAVSQSGVLAYLSEDESRLQTVLSIGLDGVEEDLPLPGGRYDYLRVSRDGQRLLYRELGSRGPVLKVLDVGRGVSTTIVDDGSDLITPVWSPDNELVAFARRSFRHEVVVRKADGSGEEIFADVSPSGFGSLFPYDWDAERKVLITVRGEPYDIWELPLSDREPSLLVGDAGSQRGPNLSPDRRWLAYQSNEEGTWQVFVRPYPGIDDAKILVGEGQQPVWGPEGDEIFLVRDGSMFGVTWNEAGLPGSERRMFRHQLGDRPGRTWDIDRKTGRFVMVRQAEDDLRIVVVQNWFDELERLVPTD